MFCSAISHSKVALWLPAHSASHLCWFEPPYRSLEREVLPVSGQVVLLREPPIFTQLMIDSARNE